MRYGVLIRGRTKATWFKGIAEALANANMLSADGYTVAVIIKPTPKAKAKMVKRLESMGQYMKETLAKIDAQLKKPK